MHRSRCRVAKEKNSRKLLPETNKAPGLFGRAAVILFNVVDVHYLQPIKTSIKHSKSEWTKTIVLVALLSEVDVCGKSVTN